MIEWSKKPAEELDRLVSLAGKANAVCEEGLKDIVKTIVRQKKQSVESVYNYIRSSKVTSLSKIGAHVMTAIASMTNDSSISKALNDMSTPVEDILRVFENELRKLSEDESKTLTMVDLIFTTSLWEMIKANMEGAQFEVLVKIAKDSPKREKLFPVPTRQTRSTIPWKFISRD